MEPNGKDAGPTPELLEDPKLPETVGQASKETSALGRLAINEALQVSEAEHEVAAPSVITRNQTRNACCRCQFDFSEIGRNGRNLIVRTDGGWNNGEAVPSSVAYTSTDDRRYELLAWEVCTVTQKRLLPIRNTRDGDGR